MLRNRSILALLAAELISNLGSRMTWLALPWFVLVTSGSATRMGIVFAVEALPIAFLGIPSGAVVQRIGALASAWGGGALLGAAAAFRVARRSSPLRIAIFAAPWFALPIWTLAFVTPAWAAVSALAVSGLAAPF